MCRYLPVSWDMATSKSDVKLIRMGTSGGLGVKPGTIVVTEKALNPLLQVKLVRLNSLVTRV